MSSKVSVFSLDNEFVFNSTKCVIGDETVKIYFVVECPQIREWELMFVVGSTPRLGMWNPENSLKMEKDNIKQYFLNYFKNFLVLNGILKL